MTTEVHRGLAPVALVVGAVCGLIGTFVPSSSLRGILWGIDGTALVVGTAILAVHHLRRGDDLAAAGFVVYVAGQTLVLATTAMELVVSRPLFGAGVALWAASLALVSAPNLMPSWVRILGAIAALLCAVTALQIFSGELLTPLSQPLPFFAYPFLAATLLGWAWVSYRDAR